MEPAFRRRRITGRLGDLQTFLRGHSFSEWGGAARLPVKGFWALGRAFRQRAPWTLALFEPVHGSAPDIAGKGVANPLGAVACVVLLLEHLGHPDAARRVEGAVRSVVAEGSVTADLGGRLTTSQVGDRLVALLDGEG